MRSDSCADCKRDGLPPRPRVRLLGSCVASTVRSLLSPNHESLSQWRGKRNRRVLFCRWRLGHNLVNILANQRGEEHSMNIDLTGKRAIVAGGSRGIGRAIALAFAQSGAAVSICARGAEALNAARDE